MPHYDGRFYRRLDDAVQVVRHKKQNGLNMRFKPFD